MKKKRYNICKILFIITFLLMILFVMLAYIQSNLDPYIFTIRLLGLLLMIIPGIMLYNIPFEKNIGKSKMYYFPQAQKFLINDSLYEKIANLNLDIISLPNIPNKVIFARTQTYFSRRTPNRFREVYSFYEFTEYDEFLYSYLYMQLEFLKDLRQDGMWFAQYLIIKLKKSNSYFWENYIEVLKLPRKEYDQITVIFILEDKKIMVIPRTIFEGHGDIFQISRILNLFIACGFKPEDIKPEKKLK